MILPLFLKVGKSSATPRHSHEMGLIFIAFVSALIFGIKWKNEPLKYIATALVSISFFNMGDFTNYHSIIHFLCIASIALIGIQFTEYKSVNEKYLQNGIRISALVQSAFAFINQFGINMHTVIYSWIDGFKASLIWESKASVGTLGNPNVLGSYLALCLPLFLTGKWRWLLPVILLAIYLCYTTTPYIVLIACLFGFYFKRLHQSALALSIPIGLVFTYFLCWFEPIKNHRIDMWNKIISLTRWENLVFGWGSGFVPLNRMAFRSHGEIPSQAHNEYLELFKTFGVAGIVIVMAILYMRKNNDNTKNAIILGSLASALTHFNLHIVITALIFTYAVSYNYQGEV